MISRQGKIETVETLKKELKGNSVVAIASVQNLPSKHLHAIKRKLRGKATAVLARETLLRMALESAKPEAKELENYFDGSCLLILSNLSAFKLAKLLRESNSKTFAKPGQIAPYDITIPAGETSLTPGPVLTELKQAKIDAKIQGQKIVISKDCTVVKKGEPISQAVAKILMKLAIEPMEVGLKMRAAFEGGMIFKEDVLDIDDKYWLNALGEAHRSALNLAVFAEIYNKDSVTLLIQKAAREANAIEKLSKSKQGITEATAEAKAEVAGKAENAPAAEGAVAGTPASEEKKEEVAPAEEKKEEVKTEGGVS